MCLAQGHKAVRPVRLKAEAPRSQVKHSTTIPLPSHLPHALNRVCLFGVEGCINPCVSTVSRGAKISNR